jgi:hypothetical protein
MIASMRLPRLSLPVCLVFVTSPLFTAAAQLTQPVAPVIPVTNTYWGHKVVDPYRWVIGP